MLMVSKFHKQCMFVEFYAIFAKKEELWKKL